MPKFHPKYPPDQNNSYAIKHIFIKIAFGQKLWGVSETQRVCGGFESSDTGALLIEERGRGLLAYIWRNKLIYARKDIKEIFTRLKKTEYSFFKNMYMTRVRTNFKQKYIHYTVINDKKLNLVDGNDVFLIYWINL